MKPVTVAEKRITEKLLDIMEDVIHPLHTLISYWRNLFSDILLLPKCRTKRLKNSSIPHAIRLYHSSLRGGGVRGGQRVGRSRNLSLTTTQHKDLLVCFIIYLFICLFIVISADGTFLKRLIKFDLI